MMILVEEKLSFRRAIPLVSVVGFQLAAMCLMSISSYGQPLIGERPVVETHLDQSDLEDEFARRGNSRDYLRTVLDHGSLLFSARFKILDGQGRPGSTGTGAPRVPDQPEFIRTSAPESNSCAGCHNQPSVGGAGDIVANVFVLAQALDPVTFSVAPDVSNERNTLGMFGAGPIEMLAREMSFELGAIREAALLQAVSDGVAVTLPLEAKGVDFGEITALPNGKIDPSGIDGVDWDLIVKPFHQKGAVVSIREFTNNAMNHHHGIQTVERFGAGVDADLDGMTDELTVGDVTAVSVYQALLATPVQVRSSNKFIRNAVRRGEATFGAIGCTECHIPSLPLDSRYYTEPNPFNPTGNLHPDDVTTVLSFDMTRDGLGERLERSKGNGAIVRAFTDLKRHNLCDDELDFFCNEQLSQGTLAGFADPSNFSIPNQPRPTEEFLTRKLWDVGNSDPYGHRGDLTTMSEAIYWHGGDARSSRDAFLALTQQERDEVIEFLKSMLVLP